MFCDQCNEKPVKVFLNQIIDGAVTQRNLCESCAAPIMGQLSTGRWNSPTRTADSLRQLLQRPADCPAEVTLTESVTVRDLATALHAQFYHIVAVLMDREIYKSADDALDFATASLVCAHYGVTPHKVV